MQTFVQRSGDRGGGQVAPWLHTRHTFSFGDWHDPRWMGWGPLRVLNDDIVAPKSGFGFHPHRDMEIVTYVLEGEIRHKDSHGNAGRIRPGEAQRMSAGSGVLHSEWNDAEGPCAFLQVWVRPREEAKGGPFSYQHARIPAGARESGWHPVADGRPADAAGGPAAAGRGAAGTSAEAEGSVTIQQDAAMLATILGGGGKRPYTFAAGRKGLLFVASGAAVAGGERLERGDSLFVAGSGTLPVEAEGAVHLVLFDVPAVAP